MQNKTTLPHIIALKIVISTVVILSIWEALALIVNDSYFLPDVIDTFKALLKIVSEGTFFKVVFTAFYRVLSGLFLGILLGIMIAFLCYKFDPVNTVLAPIISIMKATPVACIIVLLWIRLNYTEIAIFVVVLMVLPIVWQNVYEGFKSIDKNLSEVADMFELTRMKRLTVLVIPSVLSYLLPAIITSVGLAWKAEVAAEIMTNSNMGRLIYDFKTVSYDTASIFAWTVVIVTLSIIFESLTKRIFGRVMNVLKA
jgi:NitT/TauT family transport system permease protein